MMKNLLKEQGQTFREVYVLQVQYLGREDALGRRDGGKLELCFCRRLKVGVMSDLNFNMVSRVTYAVYLAAAQEPTRWNDAERAVPPYRRTKYYSVGVYWPDVEIRPTQNGSRLLIAKELRRRREDSLFTDSWARGAICETEEEVVELLYEYLAAIGVPEGDLKSVGAYLLDRFHQPKPSLWDNLRRLFLRPE